MGRALCTIEGFIVTLRSGTTKSGKPYLSIGVCCGKSVKDEATGQYDNSNQQWWDLTAYGDYAKVLEMQGLAKGDAIVARVSDPKARVFHNEKSQRYEATISAKLWNFSLARAFWFRKENNGNDGSGGGYPQEGMSDDDFTSMMNSGMGEIEIPF